MHRHTSLEYTTFDPAVETTESVVKQHSNLERCTVAASCHHHVEIKADVNAQVLSYGERDIQYLGIASADAEGKWLFCGNIIISDLPRTNTEDVITRAGNLASG